MMEYNKFFGDAVDDCLNRMDQGESVESCIASYPEIRDELYSCLRLTGQISRLSVIQPSQESIDRIKTGLTTRIQNQSKSRKTIPETWRNNVGDQLGNICLRLSWVRVATAAIILTLLFTTIYSVFPSPTKIQASAKLNILSGSAQTSQSGAAVFRDAADDLLLHSGTIVRTAPDSHVLITFLDESTIELDPNTEVLIQYLPESWDGSEGVSLKQSSGRAWSHLTNSTQVTYQIETPNVDVLAQKGMFSTEIQDDGFTKLSLIEGNTKLVGSDQEVTLTTGMQTTISPGSQLTNPQSLHPPEYQMVVKVNKPSVASVTAPSGASTGMLDDDTAFFQIPGATSERTDDGSQIITIPEPENGSYMLTLRYVTGGNSEVSIEGINQGKVICSYKRKLIIDKNKGSTIQFNSHIDDKDDWEITGTGSTDNFDGHGPEKLPKISSSDVTVKGKHIVYADQDTLPKSDVDHGKSNSSSSPGKKDADSSEVITTDTSGNTTGPSSGNAGTEDNDKKGNNGTGKSDVDHGKSNSSSSSGKKDPSEKGQKDNANSASAGKNDADSSEVVTTDTSGNTAEPSSDNASIEGNDEKGNNDIGKSDVDHGKSNSSSSSGKKDASEKDQKDNANSASAGKNDADSSEVITTDTSGNTAEPSSDNANIEGNDGKGNNGVYKDGLTTANDSKEDKGNRGKHSANAKKDKK